MWSHADGMEQARYARAIMEGMENLIGKKRPVMISPVFFFL